MNFWVVILMTFFMQHPLQEEKRFSIILNVSQIENEDGVIRALLFSDPDGFPDQPEKALKSATSKIRGTQAEIQFGNLPEGNYAISVIHDTQEKGKLRTNALGIPKDGYGFSNNASGTFGPPSFKKASFRVDKNVEVAIKLQ